MGQLQCLLSFVQNFTITNDCLSLSNIETLLWIQKNEKTTQEKKKNNKLTAYLKKLGLVGFLFFFIKGLVWIVIFVFGVKGCNSLF